MQAYRDVRIIWFYRPATCYVISFQLQVAGRPYTAVGFDNMGGRTAHPGETSTFRSGQSYPCWYDPWNPEQAVLRKQVYLPFYLGLAIPALFLLVGGSMLARSLRTVPSLTLAGRGKGDALAAVGIDVFLVYHLVRGVRGIGIPEPVVEIEREPVPPGGRARILLR